MVLVDQHRGREAMPYDGRAVANAILDIADGRDVHLTHMAVHKLAFYAHGWRMVDRDEPLIRQSFEAWEHGPVLRQVWETLKTGRDKRVTRRATRFDPIAQRHEVVLPAIASEDLAFLESIVAAYGSVAGSELSAMTHAKGGPWDRVWNAADGKIIFGMRISHELIREHFLAVTQRGVLS